MGENFPGNVNNFIITPKARILEQIFYSLNSFQFEFFFVFFKKCFQKKESNYFPFFEKKNKNHNRAPFTLQRICEILDEPAKHYNRLEKVLLSLEKCFNVSSTLPYSEDSSALNGQDSQDEEGDDEEQEGDEEDQEEAEEDQRREEEFDGESENEKDKTSQEKEKEKKAQKEQETGEAK